MEKDSKVGTVSVDGEISMTHTQLKRDVLAQYLYFANEPNSLDLDDGMTVEEQREAIKELFEEAPDNLNPGDNEHIYTGYGEEASRPGTDHEINVTVENTGSKSILTRVLVEIEGTAADKTVLTKEDLSRVHVYFDSHNTISGISSIHENYWDWLDYLYECEAPDDENKMIYAIDPEMVRYSYDDSDTEPTSQPLPEIIKSGFLLSGAEDAENREVEKYVDETWNNEEDDWDITTKDCPTKGTFKLDLGLSEYEGDDENDKLEGASLTITVKIQGMQYRNTKDSTWEDLFEEQIILLG